MSGAVTLDPSFIGSGITLTNNNLTVTTTGSGSLVRSTHSRSSGKWYWEVTFNSGNNAMFIGISNSNQAASGGDSFSSANNLNNKFFYGLNGYVYPQGTAYGATLTAGDVIGVALDMDNGTLSFYRNGTNLGISHTNIKSMGAVYPSLGSGSSTSKTFTMNFGDNPFKYSAPSGFYHYNYAYKHKILLSSGREDKRIGFEEGAISTETAIPVMSSESSPYGIVFSNSENGGNVAWKAFDNIDTSSSYWQSNNNNYPLQIGYQYREKILIGAYALIVHNTTFSPKTWDFQGSNNNEKWDTLDTQTTPLTANTLMTYKINKPNYYRYYRLNITGTNGATTTMISGFRMYEKFPNKLIKLDRDRVDESDFIKYGVDGRIDFYNYVKSENYVSDFENFDSGKTFTHTIDMSKRRVDKIILS